MMNIKAQKDSWQIEETMVPWMGRTAKYMMLFMTQHFEGAGADLTPKQWIALRYLMDEDGVDQKRLALITDRDKTSLTRLITGMEKRELVKRVPSDTDKRVNRLFITEKGSRMFKDMVPVVERAIEQMQNGISDEDVQSVIRVSKAIQANIKRTTTQTLD